MIRLKDKEFSDIVQYMRDEYGINLEKKKVLIECRMSKILERYGLDSFAGYLDMVHQDRSGEMAGEMVNHIPIFTGKRITLNGFRMQSCRSCWGIRCPALWISGVRGVPQGKNAILWV